MYDILIRGGHILDGTGNPWYAAEVGIAEGKIQRIGQLEGARARRVLEAQGLAVAPGFIDIHNHSDTTLLINPRAASLVRMGCTTCVVGNCGYSLAPLRNPTRGLCLAGLPFPKSGLDFGWTSFGEYLGEYERRGVAINVASLVGHGTVRIGTMGLEARPPTAGELREMEELVEEAMRAGAFGISTGLAYPPGFFASTEELVAMTKVVAKYGGYYASHIRSDARASFVAAVAEAIEVGERAGTPVQVSHIESHYPAWGQSADTLRLIDEARARSVEASCDLPIYLFGESWVASLLPDWMHEGGTGKMLERLSQEVVRERIRQEYREEPMGFTGRCLAADGHWDKLILASSEKNSALVGQTFQEIARQRGVEPLDAVFDLLLEEGQGAAGLVLHLQAHNEDDLVLVLTHPTSMVETDGMALADYGPLSEGRRHPRSFGTFPALFRKYVRGETRAEMPLERGRKAISAAEAIRKTTSLPAQRLGLRDRGLVAEGKWADLVVFDLDAVTDRATYAHPYQYPAGIEYVLVNGTVAVERGEHTGALAGKVLRAR